MATDDVIASLVDDLRPVAPLRLPRVRLARWLMAAAALGAAAVAALGMRADIVPAARSVPFKVHVVLLALAVIGSAATALTVVIPGEPVSRLRRSAPVVAAGAWIAWLTVEVWSFVAVGHQAWPVASGWGCVAKAATVGAAPSLLLAVMLARGAPSRVREAVTYAALAGAAIGALGVEVTCPLSNPIHLLLWHAGPAAAVVVTAALACGAILTVADRVEHRQ